VAADAAPALTEPAKASRTAAASAAASVRGSVAMAATVCVGPALRIRGIPKDVPGYALRVHASRVLATPRAVLVVMCVGYFLVLLDVTIVNVALYVIAAALALALIPASGAR
jgi:hypothetical protein